ncbi:MAG: PBECR4 domain-containing protein [Lachnospiraceae bacterium]|nr:PBECR4 domain-containing protein [Lachnospiraceae bacterium]
MNYSKDDAVKIVVACAEKYKAELENKNLLFICVDKHKRSSYIEFAFHDYNYMHLTGLKGIHDLRQDAARADGELTATDFYKRCLEHKLSTRDFVFADDGTTPMKLDVLPFVICKNLSANMVGSFNSSRPKLYTEKVAGGERAYMGFVKDAMSGEYVPNTVVKEDLRKSVSDYVRIVLAYRKAQTEEKYIERVYIARKVEWSRIRFPDEFAYLPKPE